jgi:phosphopentomutase
VVVKKNMKRAFLLVLDSFGIGASADADKFGDTGANTLKSIATNYNLKLPNLIRFGLGKVAAELAGFALPNLNADEIPEGIYGYAAEKSFGKDTPSGHWEMTGVPVLFDWGYFPNTTPCFPEELIETFIKKANVPGILGNCHASGTEIIEQFGAEHIKTQKPICYTSADSVFQIAAHEEKFGLERLYKICEIAFELVKPYKIGRVIARPFSDEDGVFYRTDHRRDFTVQPPAPTLLDELKTAGGEVIAIGKISDIFAGRGITKKIESYGNENLFITTLNACIDSAKNIDAKNILVFTNFVDFDMKYGHRRDIAGYAKALEKFDEMLPELEKNLLPDDIVIITADHGCDPAFKGSDHTREYVPILVFGPKIKSQNIGKRETFADIGQSLAKHFGLNALPNGKSFL